MAKTQACCIVAKSYAALNLANFKLALLAADARKKQRLSPPADSELKAKAVRVAADLLCFG